MKKLELILWLILLLIYNSIIAMEKKQNLKFLAEAEEKLKAKRALQQSITKIREIKREIAKKNQKTRSPRGDIDKKGRKELNRQFREMFKKQEVYEIQKFLKKYKNMDINQPIKYNNLGNIVYELAIISAAVVFSNLEIVKILLNYGAVIDFPEGSLIYKILDGINDNLDGEEIMINDLIILLYLLKYSQFSRNKNEDSRNCEELWLKIMHRVSKDELKLGKDSVIVANSIWEQFFAVEL